MSTFIDSPEQARVINAPNDDDILVVAGAGSGKTYTMTRRIVTLIGNGVSPERILGLTFTRKAAGELLERVSAAVADQSGAGEDADRMFLKPTISTYDAFFQTIVRQYGLLVGFDGDTQPLSDAGALQLAADVVERHLDELAAQGETGRVSELARDVRGLSNAIASAMIGPKCPGYAEAIAEIRRWDGVFSKRVRAALGDEPVPDSLFTKKPPKRYKKYSEEQWQAAYEEYQANIQGNCIYRCDQLAQTAERRDMLLNLVEEYNAEKRRRHMAEFGDFTIAAYQLVSRFPSIGRRYRERFSHILLDEYQDTSTTQAMLLAALFHPSDKESCSAVSAVGDPFQSIYAWRGASPGAFRMFERDFGMPAGTVPYALSTTRRNSRIVLEAANDLTLPLRTAPRRPSSAALREVDVPALANIPEADQGTIGVIGYGTLGQQIDGVVRFCREAIRRHTVMKDGNVEHRGTVAVLFRSKSTMAEYQQALEQAGMTTFVVGYSAVLERPEIRDVLALLHVIVQHDDAKHLMRLLATPRFHLSGETLTRLAALAERENSRMRFRTLVEAGVVSGDCPPQERNAAVREHRDQVANVVFLGDVLQRGDLEQLLEREGGFDERGKAGVLHAGAVLREVQAMVGHPLAEVIRAVVRALDLDIDTVVAQAMQGGEQAANPTVARMPMNTLTDLADTYIQELGDGRTSTLRGFLAWLDELGAIEDEAASMHDEQADVELMTIHQSKGLEWDAVAVVDLASGIMPDNSKNGLHIELDEAHAGGLVDGVWTPPEYRETNSKIWLTDETSVPAPIRVDADILPRFPHESEPGADPVEALARLEDVVQIDDEVFGSLREVGDGVEDSNPDGWYLTQQHEYGRRLHADERRLAYVALTRARHDAMLSYCTYRDRGRDPRSVPDGSQSKRASVFWQELYDALHTRPDAVHQPTVTPDADADAMPPLPEGFFAGAHAREYEDAVIGEAWASPIEQSDETITLPWPGSLSVDIAQRLHDGALAVRERMATMHGSRGSVATLGEKALDGNEGTEGPLRRRARQLTEDEDLMTGQLTGDELDRNVRERGRRLLAAGRQSVTALQAAAGGMTDREERAYWRGIVRPIPNVASPAAEAGTRFHAWAERFVNAVADGAPPDADTPASRRALLGELEAEESRSGEHPDALLVWERRLAESRWASREPVWAERQIVVAIPQLGGTIVNGKLDAVFAGGLDAGDASKQYTIVDWKTGRRPRSREDVAHKLVQLDCYRLLLSAVEGVPLDAIDAALYYVSEPDEKLREVRAEMKTEAQILDALRLGVPDQSDND